MLDAASRACLTKFEDSLTDENEDEDEDDDAVMRLSFWRILRHKKPKRPCIAQKTMAETVKRSIHTHRAQACG
ncbi:hypothetical protein [Limnohabitans parvus]|uniref:hypothetical protein n=1 Tax=Limnohabitans parvus TaxID=540061 RepID=UPI00142E2028|nr:hypothetical protein [Limnohabitans parvus]